MLIRRSVEFDLVPLWSLVLSILFSEEWSLIWWRWQNGLCHLVARRRWQTRDLTPFPADVKLIYASPWIIDTIFTWNIWYVCIYIYSFIYAYGYSHIYMYMDIHIYRYIHIFAQIETYAYIWVNYNDLTVTSLGMMVNKGIHPKMALIQVSEILQFTHIYIYICVIYTIKPTGKCSPT